MVFEATPVRAVVWVPSTRPGSPCSERSPRGRDPTAHGCWCSAEAGLSVGPKLLLEKSGSHSVGLGTGQLWGTPPSHDLQRPRGAITASLGGFLTSCLIRRLLLRKAVKVKI